MGIYTGTAKSLQDTETSLLETDKILYHKYDSYLESPMSSGKLHHVQCFQNFNENAF